MPTTSPFPGTCASWAQSVFETTSRAMRWIVVVGLALGGIGGGTVTSLASDRDRVAWSPDGRWIAYVVANRTAADLFPDDWWALDDSQRLEPADAAGPISWTLWATEWGTGRSVALARSAGPLGAPVWRPDGGALAYVQLDPASNNPALPRQRTLWLQTAPNRRVPLDRRPHPPEWDRLGVEPVAAPAFSRNGRKLAYEVYDPQTGPGVVVARLTAERLEPLQTLPGVGRPVWSGRDDSLACFALESHGRLAPVAELVVFDPDFNLTARSSGVLTASTPVWTNNGQLVYAAIVPAPTKLKPMALTILKEGRSEVWFKPPEPRRVGFRDAARSNDQAAEFRPDRDPDPPTLLFDLAPDGEHVFVTVRLRDHPSEVSHSLPRTGEIRNRFPPLDHAGRIAGLSVAPTGDALAVRYGCDALATPPLVLTSNNITDKRPLAPDGSAAREWLARFAALARAIQRDDWPALGLSETNHQHENSSSSASSRWSLVPLPDEVPANDPNLLRLRRLAQLGRDLQSQAVARDAGDPTRPALNDPARLRRLEPELDLVLSGLVGEFEQTRAAIQHALSQPRCARDRDRLLLLDLQCRLRDDPETTRAGLRAWLDRPAPPRRMERLLDGPPALFDDTPEMAARSWAERLLGLLEQPRERPAEVEPPPLNHLDEFFELNRGPLEFDQGIWMRPRADFLVRLAWNRPKAPDLLPLPPPLPPW